MAKKVPLRSAAWREGWAAPIGALNPYLPPADKRAQDRAADWQDGYSAREAFNVRDAARREAREARLAGAAARRLENLRGGLAKAHAARIARAMGRQVEKLGTQARIFEEAGQGANARACRDAAGALARVKLVR